MRSTRLRRKKFLRTDGNVLLEFQGPFNRLNDAYFKSALGSPERKHILIAFLNALLRHIKLEGEEPLVIEDVEFIDREIFSRIQCVEKDKV